jgi:hypothetical protein
VLAALTVCLATAYPEELVGHEVFRVFRLVLQQLAVMLSGVAA